MPREAILGKTHPRKAAELMCLGCLWNTFVTVGRARTFLELLRSQVPETMILAEQAVANLDAQGAYESEVDPIGWTKKSTSLDGAAG